MARRREGAKTIHAVDRGDPDVALAVFEQPHHIVARKALGACEDVGAPAVDMDEPSVLRADPERTIPVAKDGTDPDLAPIRGKRKELDAIVADLVDAIQCGDD